MVRSKSFEQETDQVEEWYKTKYNVDSVSTALNQKIVSPQVPQTDKKLGLPPANNLIPKNFEVKQASPSHAEKPSLLKQWPNADLWY